MDYAAPFSPSDFVKTAILGLILTAGQGSADAWLGWAGWGPEWALLLAIYVSRRTEKWAATGAAFIFGLFRDAAGGGPAGVYQLGAIALVWFFHPRRLRFNLEAWPSAAFCAFGLVLADEFLVTAPLMALLNWPGEGFNPAGIFLKSAAASALAAPFLFRLLDRLTGRRAAARGSGV